MPPSQSVASGCGRFCSSKIVKICPTELLRTTNCSFPLRTTARLALPLPMKSITYTPRWFNCGNSKCRSTRRKRGLVVCVGLLIVGHEAVEIDLGANFMRVLSIEILCVDLEDFDNQRVDILDEQVERHGPSSAESSVLFVNAKSRSMRSLSRLYSSGAIKE